MEEKRIFFAIPAYDNKLYVRFVTSLMALVVELENQFEIHYDCGEGIGPTRNNLADEFLRTNCTHLFFLDADMIFKTSDVRRILSHDVSVVGGMYPRRTDKLSWCLNETKPKSPTLENGLREVRHLGTGFLCIARGVFEAIIKADGDKITYNHLGEQVGKIGHDFFHMGVHESVDEGVPVYLSEDWWFCTRWRELGGSIFVDTKVILKHMGYAIWPLPHHYKTNPELQPQN